MVDEAILLRDRGGFLRRKLEEVRVRMAELGSRRVTFGEGWYWDLKPSSRLGEAVVL